MLSSYEEDIIVDDPTINNNDKDKKKQSMNVIEESYVKMDLSAQQVQFINAGIEEGLDALEEEYSEESLSLSLSNTEEEEYSIESDDDDKFSMFWKKNKEEKFERLANKSFFKRLKKLPNIDQISITESESLSSELSTKRESQDTKLEKAEADLCIKLLEEEATAFEEITEMVTSTETEYSDFDYSFETTEDEDEKHVVETKLADENLYDMFIKHDKKHIVLFQAPDFDSYARLDEARQLSTDVHYFLDAVIKAVVEVAEYIDTREVLRQKLDKVQLFKKFTNILEEIHFESKVNQFLASKCVIYYRRMKCFRQITPDKTEDLPIVREKFLAVSKELNSLLEREIAVSTKVEKNIQVAQVTITGLEKERNVETMRLEMVIRKCFQNRKSMILQESVERSLKNMSSLRQEISTLRNLLIQRQHTEILVKEEMSKVENVTDKLRLNDFQNILSEQSAVQKSIEYNTKRNVKLRDHFKNFTHNVAHYREKQNFMFCNAKEQLEKLSEAEIQKRELRLYNHELKLYRIKLLKQIQEKSLECGLVDKPALLIDYDQTVELGIKMKAKIDKMKSQLENLQKKIFTLNEKLKCCKKT